MEIPDLSKPGSSVRHLECLGEVTEGEHVVVSAGHEGGTEDGLDPGQQLAGGGHDGLVQLLGQALAVVLVHVAIQDGIHDACQCRVVGLGEAHHSKVPLREKKISLLVLLFKVQFFTPFTFFRTCLSSCRIKILKFLHSLSTL